MSSIRSKMQQAGLESWQIDRFEEQCARLRSGEKGLLMESELQPLPPLPSREALPAAELSDGVVVIKLNGGLGTSMGLESPKGLVEVRQGLSFLDLTLRQIDHLGRVPLLLMNSFYTREMTLERLKGRSNHGLPLDFVQSKVPKLRQDDWEPVQWPDNPELEWCPPGHGEIYSALKDSGLLDRLLEAGYGYAFVSNIDNLGASLDPVLYQWFRSSQLDFAMEVTRRTEQDKKGGHLTQVDGRLALRERAQCPSADLAAFEDIDRHRYFNTNNLWLNLDRLRQQGLPRLPLIVNRKTVDPTRPESTPVIQLESAMGAAISAFPRTAAVEVPRSRFFPVKNLADLLLLRSDVYSLDEAGHLSGSGGPRIELEVNTYADFCRQFPTIPGLKGCRSLRVRASACVRELLTLQGDVELS